jgi:hypothetical protein
MIFPCADYQETPVITQDLVVHGILQLDMPFWLLFFSVRFGRLAEVSTKQGARIQEK